MERKIIFCITVVIAMMINSGCENLNDPGEIKIKNSVFCNLRANDSLQYVYIYNTADLSAEAIDYAADPFIKLFNRNAEITVKNLNNGTNTVFKLTQDTVKATWLTIPYKPYYTNDSPFKAKPLTDYAIYVKVDESMITGNVTTPGDFEITAPRIGEVIGQKELKEFAFIWGKSKNASIYKVRLHIPFVEGVIGPQYWLEYETRDTAITFKSMRLNSEAFDSGICVFQVLANDDNYFQHYYNKKNIVGINGAYGCFSSSVLKEVKFMFSQSKSPF